MIMLLIVGLSVGVLVGYVTGVKVERSSWETLFTKAVTKMAAKPKRKRRQVKDGASAIGFTDDDAPTVGM